MKGIDALEILFLVGITALFMVVTLQTRPAVDAVLFVLYMIAGGGFVSLAERFR